MMGPNQDVDVLRCPRMAMKGHRVSTHHHKLDVCVHHLNHEIAKVVGQFHYAVFRGTKRMGFGLSSDRFVFRRVPVLDRSSARRRLASSDIVRLVYHGGKLQPRSTSHRSRMTLARLALIQLLIRRTPSSDARPTQPSVVSNQLTALPNHRNRRSGPCKPTEFPV